MQESYLGSQNYSELPSIELVELYVSKKAVNEEFKLYHRIFTHEEKYLRHAVC